MFITIIKVNSRIIFTVQYPSSSPPTKNLFHLQDLKVGDGGMLLNIILSLKAHICLAIHIQMHSKVEVGLKMEKRKSQKPFPQLVCMHII